MLRKTGHIAAASLLIIASSPTSLIAGGLFGEQTLFQGELGSTLDTNSLRTLEEAQKRQAPPVLNQQDLWSKSIPFAPGSAPELKSYEQLQMQKSQAQRQSESKAQAQFNIGVNNICLTALGACKVQYTTKGSTCFCSTGGSVELGIVQGEITEKNY